MNALCDFSVICVCELSVCVCLERVVCISFICFLYTVNKVIFTVLPLYLFKVQFINEGISRPFNTNCDIGGSSGIWNFFF